MLSFAIMVVVCGLFSTFVWVAYRLLLALTELSLIHFHNYEDGNPDYESFCVTLFIVTVLWILSIVFFGLIFGLGTGFLPSFTGKLFLVFMPIFCVLLRVSICYITSHFRLKTKIPIALRPKHLSITLAIAFVCAISFVPTIKWTFQEVVAEWTCENMAAAESDLIDSYTAVGISDRYIQELLLVHPRTPQKLREIIWLQPKFDSNKFSNLPHEGKTKSTLDTFDYKTLQFTYYVKNIVFILVGLVAAGWLIWMRKKASIDEADGFGLKFFNEWIFTAALTLVVSGEFLVAYVLIPSFLRPAEIDALAVIPLVLFGLPFMVIVLLPSVYLGITVFQLFFVRSRRSSVAYGAIAVCFLIVATWSSLWVIMSGARDILSPAYWKSYVIVTSVYSSPDILSKIYAGPYGHNKQVVLSLVRHYNTPMETLLQISNDFKTSDEIALELAKNPKVPEIALAGIVAASPYHYIVSNVLSRANTSCMVTSAVLLRKDIEEMPYDISKSACDSYRKLGDKCQRDPEVAKSISSECKLIDNQIALHVKNSKLNY